MAKIEGEAAKLYDAVRRDSFDVVNRGTLLYADEATGEVRWQKGEEHQSLTLGEDAIRIVRRGR